MILLVNAKALLAHYATTAAAIADLQLRLEAGDRLEAHGTDGLRIVVGVRPVFRGGRTWLVDTGSAANAKRVSHDKRLIAALKDAHGLLKSHNIAPADPQTAWREARSPAYGYHRKVALAFLAPDIQQAIIDGRQPVGLSFTHMMERGVPASWAEQRLRFGFPKPPL